MSIWSISQNRNISNIIFKIEFKECSHVHSTPQTLSTVTVSNVGANGLIHINGRLIAPTLLIHNQVEMVYTHPSFYFESQQRIVNSQHNLLDLSSLCNITAKFTDALKF